MTKRRKNTSLAKQEALELPSTSPANASIPDAKKFKQWKDALLAVINI